MGNYPRAAYDRSPRLLLKMRLKKTKSLEMKTLSIFLFSFFFWLSANAIQDVDTLDIVLEKSIVRKLRKEVRSCFKMDDYRRKIKIEPYLFKIDSGEYFGLFYIECELKKSNWKKRIPFIVDGDFFQLNCETYEGKVVSHNSIKDQKKEQLFLKAKSIFNKNEFELLLEKYEYGAYSTTNRIPYYKTIPTLSR
jgi:hypothetical protein